MAPIIGSAYGSTFEVKTIGGQEGAEDEEEQGGGGGGGNTHKNTHKKNKFEQALVQIDPVPVWDSVVHTDKDNSKLIDDGTAQTLSSGEIFKMTKEGKGGQDIIQALKDKSATFAAKVKIQDR